MKDGPLVLTRTFPVLHPNKIVAAVGAIDQKLNPALDASLRSRLRPLQADGGKFTLGATVTGKLEGRTLLFVHGTFSNADNMLGEFEATDEGARFLRAATSGARKYDHVVFFEHATLAVSPVLNALELGRFFANSSGQIDVIAHSRGGLVVRWWLEAFGKSLSILPAAPVRAVLVGSPLRGTSLAAPDKLQDVLSLLSNIGSFAQATLNLAGTANPFIWVAGALVQVVVSATGALARTPLVDGLVALVPGLAGQSAVDNNHEINRLRLGPCAVDPLYYVVQSNFETADPGWKFWQNFRALRAADVAADFLFPGHNDLVVDTEFMTDLGVPNLQLADPPCDHGTSDTVWHCSYFREPKTINYITEKLALT
jgi:pimeloyl-ACP methyl ester carboxylesterase